MRASPFAQGVVEWQAPMKVEDNENDAEPANIASPTTAPPFRSARRPKPGGSASGRSTPSTLL